MLFKLAVLYIVFPLHTGQLAWVWTHYIVTSSSVFNLPSMWFFFFLSLFQLRPRLFLFSFISSFLVLDAWHLLGSQYRYCNLYLCSIFLSAYECAYMWVGSKVKWIRAEESEHLDLSFFFFFFNQPCDIGQVTFPWPVSIICINQDNSAYNKLSWGSIVVSQYVMLRSV